MRPPIARPLEPGLRFLLACGLLLALFHWHGQPLIEALLPLFRWELGLVGDHFRILGLKVAAQGADRVIRLEVTLARLVIVGGHVVFPDPRGVAMVSTLAGHVLQPVILFLGVLAAWPASGWRDHPCRVLVGLPILLLLLMADVPLVLLAELWAMFDDPAGHAAVASLHTWKTFLLGGGRLALGLVGGAVAVAVAGSLRSVGAASRAR